MAAKKEQYICVSSSGGAGVGESLTKAYSNMIDSVGDNDTPGECDFFRGTHVEVKTEIKEVITEK